MGAHYGSLQFDSEQFLQPTSQDKHWLIMGRGLQYSPVGRVTEHKNMAAKTQPCGGENSSEEEYMVMGWK